jgi:hypothetical protein
MIEKTRVIFGTVALLAGLITGARAQPMGRPMPGGPGAGRWESLGQARVDGMIDHDNIQVGGNRGMFRSIQLRVQDGAIQFQRVIVHFGNGADQVVQMRNRIPAGGQTRAIDLPGQRRNLRSVELFYSRGNWGGRRPTVTLYGRR